MEQKKKRKPEASCLVTVIEKPLYFFKHALKLVFQLIWFLLQKCAASEKEWSWESRPQLCHSQPVSRIFHLNALSYVILARGDRFLMKKRFYSLDCMS